MPCLLPLLHAAQRRGDDTLRNGCIPAAPPPPAPHIGMEHVAVKVACARGDLSWCVQFTWLSPSASSKHQSIDASRMKHTPTTDETITTRDLSPCDRNSHRGVTLGPPLPRRSAQARP